MSTQPKEKTLRVGVAFYNGGVRVPVEAGSRIIGYTSHDEKVGTQVFWMAEDEFKRHAREIFECNGPNRPVPVFTYDVPAPKVKVIDPHAPKEAPEPSEIERAANVVLAALGGRTLPVAELASELEIEPEALMRLFGLDPRFKVENDTVSEVAKAEDPKPQEPEKSGDQGEGATAEQEAAQEPAQGASGESGDPAA